MRDIKFRAWDKSGKEPRMVLWEELKPCTCEAVFLSTIQPHIVTLMQFTNLHDRKGKEIYEGDILKREIFYNVDRRITIVAYQKGCICLVTPGDEPTDGRILCKTDELFSGKIEVIGNIYENPELLTQ